MGSTAKRNPITHRGFCIPGNGKGKVRDVGVWWGDGDGKDAMQWACNSWYPECNGQCKAETFWCDYGTEKLDGLNQCGKWLGPDTVEVCRSCEKTS